MEAISTVVRRRSNSTVDSKPSPRYRCHSVHLGSGPGDLGRLPVLYRSRASSLSSFSSSPSRVSSLVSGYNTELFWNRYRRTPDTSIITNIVRRTKFRRKKSSSSSDLLNTSLEEWKSPTEMVPTCPMPWRSRQWDLHSQDYIFCGFNERISWRTRLSTRDGELSERCYYGLIVKPNYQEQCENFSLSEWFWLLDLTSGGREKCHKWR